MPRNASRAPEPQRGTKQSIAFGLVNVPVKVRSLKESRTATKVSANYICPAHKEKCKTQRFCEAGNHTVDDAVKAFPTENGYVQLDEDVLHQIAAEKTGELRIDAFVPADSIDPIYFDTPYLVYPGEGGQSVYDLLATGLRETGMAAVGNGLFGGAKAVQLIVIRWSDATETMVAHSCLYDNAIRWQDVDLVANAAKARPAPAKAQVDLAEQIIAGLTGKFDPAAVEDTYTSALADLIEQAAAGQPIKAPTPAPAAATPVDDIMAALRSSVAQAKGKPAPAANGKKPAARKKAKA